MTIRCRLHDGRWSKARRGELAKRHCRSATSRPRPVPCSSTRTAESRIAPVHLRPVRRTASGPTRGRFPAAAGLQVPAQAWGGPGHGGCGGRCRHSVPIMGTQSCICRGARLWAEGAATTRLIAPRRPGRPRRRPGRWPTGRSLRPRCVSRLHSGTSSRNQQTLVDNWFRAGTRGLLAAGGKSTAPGDHPMRPMRGPDERVLPLDEGEAEAPGPRGASRGTPMVGRRAR